MKCFTGLLLFTSLTKSIPVEKNKKTFSLFSVVSFPNAECKTNLPTDSATTTQVTSGLCLTANECSDAGGTPKGNCASSFGVCCFISISESGTLISRNITYIQNEGYPQTTVNTQGTWSFRLKGDADICQFRLDFDDVVLQQPRLLDFVSGDFVNGNFYVCVADQNVKKVSGSDCTTNPCTLTFIETVGMGDSFTVQTPSASMVGFGNLCGTLTGQHIYIPYSIDVSTGSVQDVVISIKIGTVWFDSNDFARRWKIKTSRINCGSPNRADEGCLQWFVDLGGRVQSFNYGAGPMFSTLLYNVCIRKGEGMCGMFVSQTRSGNLASSDSFDLGTRTGAIPDNNAHTGSNCQNQYIGIESTKLTSSRYCGKLLSSLDGATQDGAIPYVGLFNYITFPNKACFGDGSAKSPSSTRLDGNCYTKQECSALKGIAAGDCALGYGVCCVFKLACEETIKQNQSYLIMPETKNPGRISCAYTICPVNSGVNRIRLDMNTFVIGDPLSLTTAEALGNGAISTKSNAIGHCVQDRFVVTSIGKATPVICGVNSGQHVFVDTDGEKCVTASFVFGGDAVTREYEIWVRQYDKSDTLGGPSGCLQYITNVAAIIRTFNFRIDDLAGSTHLSYQNYDICIRRERGYCSICLRPEILGGHDFDPDTNGFQDPRRGSFGLSNVMGAKICNNLNYVKNICANTNINTAFRDPLPTEGAPVSSGLSAMHCTSDYIMIPNGNANWENDAGKIPWARNDKYCGRYLNANQHAIGDGYVCSQAMPFSLTVITDGNEQFAADPSNPMQAGSDARTNEALAKSFGNLADGNYPVGTMGFSLTVSQQPCPT